MRRRFLKGGLAVGGLGLAGAGLSGCFDPPQKSASTPAVPPSAPVTAPTSASATASESSAASSSSDIPVIDPASLPDVTRVRIETEKGNFTLELYPRRAPLTVVNFLMYVEAGKLDGAEFYRASKSGPDGGFIQMEATGVAFPPIAHESTKKTGLSHINGAISTARFAVGTATNEFVICVGDLTYMDAGHDPSGDNQGYAVFGQVSGGMKTVRAILRAPVNKGNVPGGWAGEMLTHPVKVISARRVN